MNKTIVSMVAFSVFNLLISSTNIYAATNSNTTSAKSALTFEQIKMAAESGDGDAQYALGYMYYYGKSGAPKDTQEAKKWIGKAADQKQPQAIKALALINRAPVPSVPLVAQNQETSAPVTEEKIIAKQERPIRMAEKQTFNEAIRQPIDTREDVVRADHRVPIAKESDKETPAKVASVFEAAKGVYTLQLLGSYHKDLVVKEIHNKQLDKNADIYQTTFNNKDWFVVLYGRYSTPEEAHQAAKTLESRLALKPWVKPCATIKTYRKLDY